MGDAPEEEQLLVSNEEEEWDKIEQGSAAHRLSVQELIKQHPDHVLRYIKQNGVAKLGEFQIQDDLILSALGERSMLTMGCDTADIHVERDWRRRINQQASKSSKLKHADAGWSKPVTVEAFVVNIRNAAAADRGGLIQPILRRWQAGAAHWSVFGLPAVQAVLEFKWDRWARSLMVAEGLLFMLWLLAFSVFMLVFQDEDTSLSLAQLLATPTGLVTVVAELLALVCMVPFLIIEGGTIHAYGLGWFNIWNMLDVSTYVLQVVISVMHLGRLDLNSGTISVLTACQCVLLFFRLNYFLRVFTPARFSLVDSLRQVVVDIRWYLFFLLLMMWGFACAYCVLFRKDQEHDQFSDVGHSLLTMLNYALGGVDLDTMLASSNPRAAMALSIVYQFTMSMVLMNLLIGVMCSSLTKATAHDELKQLLCKAQAIDELESTLPPWVERLLLRHCFPQYVHVLRIEPKSLDTTPDPDEVWRPTRPTEATTSSSQQAAGGGAAGAASTSQLQALVDEVAALRAQMTHINGLLQTVVASQPPSPSRSFSPERY